MLAALSAEHSGWLQEAAADAAARSAADLNSDPDTAELIAAIEALKASVPVLALRIPAGCTGDAPAVAAPEVSWTCTSTLGFAVDGDQLVFEHRGVDRPDDPGRSIEGFLWESAMDNTTTPFVRVDRHAMTARNASVTPLGPRSLPVYVTRGARGPTSRGVGP